MRQIPSPATLGVWLMLSCICVAQTPWQEEEISPPLQIAEEGNFYAEGPPTGQRPVCPDCGGWHGLGRRCGHILGDRGGLLPSSRWLPRHLDRGEPLETSSWLNRPFSLGVFGGSLLADELIEGEVDQSGDFFGGLRIGWDFDHYWGTEVRLGWAELSVVGTPSITISTVGDVFFADWVFLYYPWGDARVRPYFLLGLGTARFDYSPDSGGGLENTLLSMPVGGGIKYQMKPWLALRFEASDNIAFGRGQFNTMHNLSLNLGIEWRLGGSRRSYYPWQPSRHIR